MNASARTLRKRQIAAALCAAAALFLAAAAVWLCATREGREIALLSDVGDPAETAARFFHALCLRDWDTASAYVRGAPELDLDRSPEDPVERRIWDAFLQSWAWSVGEGGRDDNITAWQTVEFTCLQPGKITRGIDREVETILRRWVNERPLQEIYSDDGQFREEVVHQALEEALDARLAQSERYLSTENVVLHLIYEDGRWKILPEDELWNALSGVGGEEGAA